MSHTDSNMERALGRESEFDATRARSAHEEVHREYQKKLKWSERHMWLLVYLLLIVAAYAAGGFAVQATTTKGWIGFGLIFLLVMLLIIQKTILFGIHGTQLVAMKEIKQLRLALTGDSALETAAAKPLRGTGWGEKVAWLVGLLAVAVIGAQVGVMTNRQDDFWRIKAGGQVEAHNVLTLRRFPHFVPSLWSIKEPIEGAILESVSLNGRPVALDEFKARRISGIQLPYRLSWKTDKIELIWSFPLPVMKDYGAFRAPLRSQIPVHAYSLSLYVEDDSGFEVAGDAWRFNKTSGELRNEAKARRTLKCFTCGGDAAREEFGTCGLAIVASSPR